MQRQAHIEKYHSAPPPASGGQPAHLESEGRTEVHHMRSNEGVAEAVRARSSKSSSGAGVSDGNPWVGGRPEHVDGSRPEHVDGSHHLIVGGGAVQRVPRSSGVTSARRGCIELLLFCVRTGLHDYFCKCICVV